MALAILELAAPSHGDRWLRRPARQESGARARIIRIVVILPRLARRLNQPLVATLLAVVLVVIGVLGLVSDDIKHGYAIGIIVIGVLNLIRAQPEAEEEEPSSTSSTG
jgi:hypothetical protein